MIPDHELTMQLTHHVFGFQPMRGALEYADEYDISALRAQHDIVERNLSRPRDFAVGHQGPRIDDAVDNRPVAPSA